MLCHLYLQSSCIVTTLTCKVCRCDYFRRVNPPLRRRRIGRTWHGGQDSIQKLGRLGEMTRSLRRLCHPCKQLAFQVHWQLVHVRSLDLPNPAIHSVRGVPAIGTISLRETIGVYGEAPTGDRHHSKIPRGQSRCLRIESQRLAVFTFELVRSFGLDSVNCPLERNTAFPGSQPWPVLRSLGQKDFQVFLTSQQPFVSVPVAPKEARKEILPDDSRGRNFGIKGWGFQRLRGGRNGKDTDKYALLRKQQVSCCRSNMHCSFTFHNGGSDPPAVSGRDSKNSARKLWGRGMSR